MGARAPLAALWDIGPHVLSVLIPLLGNIVRIDAHSLPNQMITFETEQDGLANVALTLHSAPENARIRYRLISETREMMLPGPPPRQPERRLPGR